MKPNRLIEDPTASLAEIRVYTLILKFKFWTSRVAINRAVKRAREVLIRQFGIGSTQSSCNS